MLIGIAVVGLVAVSLAGGRPDTVPIERPGESDEADCCCGGTVDGCSDDCADCEAAGACGSDSCDCESDSCDCDSEADCGCGSHADADCSDDHLHAGCGGCH